MCLKVASFDAPQLCCGVLHCACGVWLNCRVYLTAISRGSSNYCHSNDESNRKLLHEDATMDVRFFAPDAATIKKAEAA